MIALEITVDVLYPTQHPKLHLDRFSHFCTAHGRQCLYFTVHYMGM